MRTHLSAALLALIALTACGSTTEETQQEQPDITPIESETEANETPVDDPTTEEEISERGSLIMEPGDEGVIHDPAGETLVAFTVHDIEVNPECSGERADDPEHEHFVVFNVEIDSDLAAADHYVDPGLIFNTAGYRVIDQDGTTRSENPNTSPAHNCLPESEQLPINLGPGEKSSGKVVFDVPVESGILLTDLGVGENLQWEWEF